MIFDMKTYDRLDPDDMSVSATDAKMGEMFCGHLDMFAILFKKIHVEYEC